MVNGVLIRPIVLVASKLSIASGFNCKFRYRDLVIMSHFDIDDFVASLVQEI